MKPSSTRPARAAIALASLALAAVAVPVVAQSDSSDGASMALEISGLASGSVVTGDHVELTVQPVGYEFSNTAGTPPVEGKGHYHLMLDGALINMFASPDASVSLQNAAPGFHTLTVVPATNDHMGVMEGAAAVEFDYQPSEPPAEITAADGGDTAAAVEFVSPAAGSEVSGPVEFTISTTGLRLSEDLLGKPNVAGYGHWHLFIDAAEGMSTLAGMSGTESLTYDTSGLAPGPHTFIAVLTDNLHAPLDPMVMATLELTVADAEDAADATAGGGDVAVSLLEWRLEPAELTLTAGTYTFEGTNGGTMGHGLAIEGEGISAATPDAQYGPGETETFTVELAPGTYEIFCPVPGHKQAGMVATVTVTA